MNLKLRNRRMKISRSDYRTRFQFEHFCDFVHFKRKHASELIVCDEVLFLNLFSRNYFFVCSSSNLHELIYNIQSSL